MPKDDVIEVEGVVTDILPGTNFKVKLINGHIISAYLCGKMRQCTVRVSVGDKVKVAMSPYDLNKGRITYRMKG
ncbi:MAG: translation initiation factor IF-1 [Christensenellales bacterium]